MRIVTIAALLFVLLGSPAYAQTTTIPPVQSGRIAVIGDSLTRGLSATHEQASFASILANELGMELGRFGVGGIAQAEDVADSVIDWRPELVVMQVGINDTSRMSAEEWGKRYRALVARFQAPGSEVVVSTLFVAHQGTNHPRHRLLRALSEQVLLTESVRIADVWGATFDCPLCISEIGVPSPHPPLYAGDGFHPGDYGHSVIAREMLHAITPRMLAPVVMSGGCDVR